MRFRRGSGTYFRLPRPTRLRRGGGSVLLLTLLEELFDELLRVSASRTRSRSISYDAHKGTFNAPSVTLCNPVVLGLAIPLPFYEVRVVALHIGETRSKTQRPMRPGRGKAYGIRSGLNMLVYASITASILYSSLSSSSSLFAFPRFFFIFIHSGILGVHTIFNGLF